MLGDVLEPLSNELAWLAGVLGPVRDLDVLIDHLRGNVEQLDADRPAGEELVAILEEQRARVRDELGEAMASERYFDLLTQFEREVAAVADHADIDVVPLAERAFKRLRRDARALGSDPEDESVHDLRKAGKRARYAAELVLPEGGRALERYIDSVKELQDVVGAHQDAVVAEERLRAMARARTAIARAADRAAPWSPLILARPRRRRRAERGRRPLVPQPLVRHASAGHCAVEAGRPRPAARRARARAGRTPPGEWSRSASSGSRAARTCAMSRRRAARGRLAVAAGAARRFPWSRWHRRDRAQRPLPARTSSSA
jgi:CHAD domain-containing protein